MSFEKGTGGGLLGKTSVPGAGTKDFTVIHSLTSGDILTITKLTVGPPLKYSVSYIEKDNTEPATDLLTKLDELKTAIDGFEPVRVVLPPAFAGANPEADVVTADIPLTAAYQDVASVAITPQSDVADLRIWLTLFWQGRMTYRVVRGTDEVVSEQSVDSTSGTLPVSYPVAHSPASTAAQTYKLQAKRAQSGTSASAKAGTTLYVREIYGA